MVPYSSLNKLKFLLFDLHGVVIPLESSRVGEKNFSDLKEDLLKAEDLSIKCGVISASEDASLLEKVKMLRGLAEVLSHSIDKVSQAEKILEKYDLTYEEVGFIGDDILDIPLLMKAGFSAAPKAARREVKRIVNYVTRDSENKTALSDVLDLISRARREQK
ncbi:MAG: HAD hydrolase family protein [Ignavibacteria bacterium]|jgi:3-deoxy-D-manno-octulosonate 8-phosphate phosphatase (KDO 8-P phosphatase)|nr:HAD hydrolase family protein [Ignavibacteria bacterium]MCU7503655.1 HAD hydrolase family protein [Ignavibacteria bacterium]MCU7517862.1 HAD hydrolase family protein [Ignavibacteria bacterium]